MSCRARNQEGENQFTTDLFLAASQLLDEVLALPTAGRADAARTGQGRAARPLLVLAAEPGLGQCPAPDLMKHPVLPQQRGGGEAKVMGPMSPSISPPIPHVANPLCPHSHPCRGTPHTLREPGQEWEGAGWEASGWQAAAAGQGKHGTTAAPETLR